MNRSLNRWIVRYLYIPLGGKNKKYVNIWIIFAFVYFIFNFENGDYLIYSICCCVLLDIEIFAKIAKALDINLSTLFEGIVEM